MGRLEEKVIASINRVMREVFGNVVMSAIQDYLMDKGLNLTDPSLNVKKFHDSLKSLFGDGAEALENAIVDDLYRSLNMPKPEIIDLVDAVRRLKEEIQ